MKLFGVLLIFFLNGVQAAVEGQSSGLEVVNLPLLTDVDIPVSNSSNDDLGVLKQLTLKVHSSEEDLQHIWNRVRVCESCHANNIVYGNGYLPILQGQNLEYLYSKLLMFQDNQRSYHPLGRYLDSLSKNDLMDISYFYARQSSALQQVLALKDLKFLNEKEKIESAQECAECHGAEGNGDQLIPAISGQNKKYLSYRIREIADNNSKVHFASDAPLSCKIKEVDVRRSRQLASLLSVVVDKYRAQQGAEVYRLKCAECHAADDGVKPDSGQSANWSKYLLHGTQRLINNVVEGNQHKFINGRNFSFSQNEMKDAIHYMIEQLQSSL